MKILLLGPKGQVGQELQKSLAGLGELYCCDREVANLEDSDSLRTLIQANKPDVIINAAAYTKVDLAESESELAFQINAHAPQTMAEEAEKLDALLIHYSTDYVFNGENNRPWHENDDACPLNIYGQSKLDGEKAIQASGCRHLILRTSWVYAAHGNNFVRTMLRLGQEREELKVVSDQIGTPTSAAFIAYITKEILKNYSQDHSNVDGHVGIYHLTPEGYTNWHEFAVTILEQARQHGLALKVSPAEIQAISSLDYPVPAQRPRYSVLDKTKLKQNFEFSLPIWQEDVQNVIKEILGVKSYAA